MKCRSSAALIMRWALAPLPENAPFTERSTNVVAVGLRGVSLGLAEGPPLALPMFDQELNSSVSGAHNMRDSNIDRPCWHPLFGALE